ncbi:MAG: methyltransferase domain-containing protein [Solirubrobacterales bacterium]
MSLFDASPAHYDRFMGRYSVRLAPLLVEAAGVEGGMRVLDVGCGPGGLTSVLVDRLAAERVAAVDPAPQFVEECRARNPGADVRLGGAEELPWEDDEFDATLSCLVIAHVEDAEAMTREMARVTRPGGTVASCMWDFDEGGMRMLNTFWTAIRAVDPSYERRENRAGTSRGQIAELLAGAGVRVDVDDELVVTVDYEGFDDFWDPFTFGVGPSGNALQSLGEADRAVVREACRAALSDGPFSLAARAWFARGTVPG